MHSTSWFVSHSQQSMVNTDAFGAEDRGSGSEHAEHPEHSHHEHHIHHVHHHEHTHAHSGHFHDDGMNDMALLGPMRQSCQLH